MNPQSLIKRLKEIPIRTNRRHYVAKYLQPFVKEIAAFAQMDHCVLFLYANSTLIRDMSVKICKDQPVQLKYGNFNKIPPWVTDKNKNNEQDIINIPDLMKLDLRDPVPNHLIGCFSGKIKSVLIIPIYLKQKNIGSIILLTETKIHHFTPGEIEILKQASTHLTSIMEKIIKQDVS